MSGKLADVYGGKRTCLVGMTLNTLASLGACFTTSKEGLYVTRGISGLGGSLSTVAGYRESLTSPERSEQDP
jgi:MFS family permease